MPNIDQSTIESLFHPRSIAVMGVSTDATRWNAGQRFVKALLESGFTGTVYPVNLDGNEIFGLKVYHSLREIPGAVDYVISAIPAENTLQLIADCGDKGVKAVHMFTAGFSETGERALGDLELAVASLARQRGVRIIGPNCMGLYCAKSGLSFRTNFPRQSGPVGFISQSGGNTTYGVLEAAVRGVYFSKVVSYGNACDLNETDFLEYLTGDPETKIIAAYIEGVVDGRNFIEVLRRATAIKPVVIFKGGTTETGARTASSHTSAIAGSDRIWSTLLRQVGAFQVDSIEEMVDVLLLFTYMSPSKGRKAAVIGLGGGCKC